MKFLSKEFEDRDFTVEKYEQLLRTIKENNIPVYGIKKWQEEKPASGVLLRHDVDRKPSNSLKIAEVEKKYDIQSTFYFRITKSSFDEVIIDRIYELGHEIGYHYEDLSLGKGDYVRACELFQRHLGKLRQLAPVETIAMHGRPLSRYDNRDLWRKYNYKEFGIVAEAFLDVDYSDMFYFTDTGRTWGETKANIRDNVEGGLSAEVNSTDDLISFIVDDTNKKIALVMHPERWARNRVDYYISLSSDLFVNTAKRFIRILRNVK